jgi:hypothetical protein
MMRAIAPCLVTAALAGCVNDPVATSPSNNPDMQVDMLFSHDGCTVYRFRDITYHYYVRCHDARSAETLSTRSCGKSCSYEEAIQTLSSSNP